MSDLAEFSRRIEQRVNEANRPPNWPREHAEKYMTDLVDRSFHFEELAKRVLAIIQPRLECVARQFINASPIKSEPQGRTSLWLGYCNRFPASTGVVFTIDHDTCFSKMLLLYEARMIPTFVKFKEHDALSLSLEAVEEHLVADWVEERLLEFLDDYFRIDRGPEDVDDDTVTDPVCGMRIRRATAAARADFTGHLYYFCTTDCQAKFDLDPIKYVRVKAM
jgi:Cu+-exporting ATPase